MDAVLLWIWSGVLAATVVWWLVMLFRVALIGPAELLHMFRSLNQPPESEKVSDEHSA